MIQADAMMAETGCRSNTRTRNSIGCTNTGSENMKNIPEWRESCHLCKIAGQPYRQIVQSFAAGSLAALHIWRSLVTKVGTTKKLPRLQRVISITYPDWAFLHPELA